MEDLFFFGTVAGIVGLLFWYVFISVKLEERKTKAYERKVKIFGKEYADFKKKK